MDKEIFIEDDEDDDEEEYCDNCLIHIRRPLFLVTPQTYYIFCDSDCCKSWISQEEKDVAEEIMKHLRANNDRDSSEDKG